MNQAWGRAVVALLTVVAIVVFVRLGLWQLSRAKEKRLAAAAHAMLLANPPVELGDSLAGATLVDGQRVHVTGAWDKGRHILLSGRTHMGAAGVALVTPVVLRSGARVLVERGWLAAADSRTVHPEEWADSTADVVGVVRRLTSSARAVPWSALAPLTPGVALWSARTLDSAEVARHVPMPYAPWSAVVLVNAGAPSQHGIIALGEPLGDTGERVHLSYAIQWFLFALITLVGSIALLVRTSRRERSATRA